MKIYIKNTAAIEASDSIQYNLDDWGKSANTNILFITGYSGSGKSTKAIELAKEHNADVIHLDLYFEGHTDNQYRSKSFDDYLEKNFPDYVKIGWPKDKININEWGKLVEEFEKQLENYGKYMYRKGCPIIAEGVELMDDTLFPNKSYFKSHPTLMMKTSQFRSNWRASQRDEVSPLNYLANMKYNVQSKKEYREFKKNVK